MIGLRAATIQDLPLIYRGEVRYMQEIEPESEDRWRRATDRNLQFWIDNFDRTRVLELDGQPIGYSIWADLDGRAVLVTINVIAAYRGQGRGRVLLEDFLTSVTAAGYPVAHLGVHVGNPARRLYEQAGFTHTGDDEDYRLYEKQLDLSGRS